MPEDGFVSLVIKNADGQVVRNLLNAKFFTKGPQEVLWDGLTTPSDRRPGRPVPSGEYTWEAIWHKGIGLSLVGWACNAGRAPFDSPGGNWGGDMGGPAAVDANDQRMYLGWAAAEAGQALVCTDFDGNVQWRHKRGGFGGAASWPPKGDRLRCTSGQRQHPLSAQRGQRRVFQLAGAARGERWNWTRSAEFKPAVADEEPAASGLAAIDGKISSATAGLRAPQQATAFRQHAVRAGRRHRGC